MAVFAAEGTTLAPLALKGRDAVAAAPVAEGALEMISV